MKGLFIGLTSIDIIYAFDDFLTENEKHKTNEQIIDIGGPATNAAYAFQSLGGDATLVSLVGQHPFRSFVLQKLKEYDIRHIDLNPNLYQRPEISSIVVNKSSGSRTIATVKPLNDFPIEIENIELEEYDILCVDGFYGEFVLPLLLNQSIDIPKVFDGGSFKKHTAEVLTHMTFPIFSERFTFPDKRDLSTFLQAQGIGNFAITRGEYPILANDKEGTHHIQVPQIEAIDTLGAGDIFHGAFCWFILQSPKSFHYALEQAAKIASMSCEFSGPRAWKQYI